MKTRVVHCKEQEFDVYIGRAMQGFPASKWANNHRIGPDGTRDEVCDKHEQDFLSNPERYAELPELRGKVLGCWCKTKRAPLTRCHGDTYIKHLLLMFPEDAAEQDAVQGQSGQLNLF